MVAGYFAWIRDTKGGGQPQKLDRWLDPAAQFPSAKKEYALVSLGYWPLDEAEFTLSLDELARRYPCPLIPSK